MARDANGKFVSGTDEPAAEDGGSDDAILKSGASTDSGDDDETGGDNGSPEASPASTDPAAITAKRKAGRPRGANYKSRKTKTPRGRSNASVEPETEAENTVSIDPDFVTFILGSIHEMAAKIVKAEELKLTPEEAAKMAQATLRVAEFYDIRMSQKAQAWAAFGTVCANIYYSRISLIIARQRKEKAEKQSARSIPQQTAQAA